jgi:hypothetical protein
MVQPPVDGIDIASAANQTLLVCIGEREKAGIEQTKMTTSVTLKTALDLGANSRPFFLDKNDCHLASTTKRWLDTSLLPK